MKEFLNKQVRLYNNKSFIALDPICIPHRFKSLQDIEISGFFAAVFAWGQRITIIDKCTDLFKRMDNAPYSFIMHANDFELKKLLHFKHRTFNDTDLLYFISFFKWYYNANNSLESAFLNGVKKTDTSVENGLNNFRNLFFSLPHAPPRTLKHVASPQQKSACKRLNMYLRWMVRKDKNGVDFGLWHGIKPSQLVCPLDVHSGRVARKLGLLQRPQNDWQAAIALTCNLKKYAPTDPVKYDFALFGMGVNGF